MEKLDLSGCETNEQVSTKIMERVNSMTCDEVIEALSPRFVYHKEAVRRIYVALATGGNALLHGPGGFGKSAIVKGICELYGIPVICKLGSKDMNPEELLGVPNMNKLLNDSTYETSFENSVFSKPGILLLEEFLDCAPSTAMALKDVITERGFREGDTKKESLVSSVIITGNKEPEIMAIDDTTKAFYQDRFPYRHKMVWSTFEPSDYLKFFKVYFGQESYTENMKKLMVVARVCTGTAGLVSPRLAAEAANTAIKIGVEFLDTIKDLDTSMMQEINDLVELERDLLVESDLLDSVQKHVIKVIDTLRVAGITEAANQRVVLSLVEDKLRDYQFRDDSMAQFSEILTLIKHGFHQIDQIFLSNFGEDRSDEVQNWFHVNTASEL